MRRSSTSPSASPLCSTSSSPSHSCAFGGRGYRGPMALRAVVVGAALIGAARRPARPARRRRHAARRPLPGRGHDRLELRLGRRQPSVAAPLRRAQPRRPRRLATLRRGARRSVRLALTGTLSWEPDDAAAAALDRHVAARAARLDARAAERERGARARARYRAGPGVEAILLFPEEGFVFPRPALAAVLALGRDAGLRVRPCARVTGFHATVTRSAA